MKTTAVIIARGGSSRLPFKNLLSFNMRPMVAHKVWQLKQCKLIDEVVVGSDDKEILAVAEKEGAIVVERAPEFCDEKSRSWNEVIEDMVSRVHADLIVWAHCTNPCIRPQTYDAAIERLLTTTCDSLVGVTRVQSHIWWQGAPLNFDPGAPTHQVAAQLQPVYIQNGGLFIAPKHLMLSRRYVYGDNPTLFEIDEGEAIDVDTQADFNRAKQLYTLVRG